MVQLGLSFPRALRPSDPSRSNYVDSRSDAWFPFYRPRREYPHPPPKKISITRMMRMVVVDMIGRSCVGIPLCINQPACSYT